MKGLKLWRTFQEGIKNYVRNGWLSVATIVVLTLSLFIVSATMILAVTTTIVLDNFREKVNISISFDNIVSEEDILAIKRDLERYKEVKSVEYVSRDQALESFKTMSVNETVITEALREIGENPLLASLRIKAESPEQYDIIARAIDRASFRDDIARNNYQANKTTIDSLESIHRVARNVGAVLGIIFVSTSFLITFNTIRINMHSRRNEFEIMRLVGASNTYVRMPSVFEGVFYGLTAASVTLLLLFAALRSVAPLTKGLISEGTLLDYYASNFLVISVSVTVFGIGLGALGGFVAVRKYLKY
jgi:cell division transport system permease protein